MPVSQAGAFGPPVAGHAAMDGALESLRSAGVEASARLGPVDTLSVRAEQPRIAVQDVVRARRPGGSLGAHQDVAGHGGHVDEHGQALAARVVRALFASQRANRDGRRRPCRRVQHRAFDQRQR